MRRHAQQPAEFRAIHVAFRWALGRVSKRVSERGQLADLKIELVGTGVKGCARQIGNSILAEHSLDLVKAEPCRLAK